MSRIRALLADFARSLPLPLSFAFLLFAVVAAFHSVPGSFPSFLKWDSSGAAAASAGFGAVAAIFFGLHQFSMQRLAESSKFSLEMAMGGVHQAYDVIQDDKPTRGIAWVNAARLLERAKRNAKAITERSHREAWDLFHEEWRIRFLSLLRAGPEYFCGIGPWTPQPDKIVVDDEFARKVSKEAYRVSSMHAPTVSATSYSQDFVQDRIIKIVYDFTEYDENWVDPISDRSGFGSEVSNPLFQRNLTGLWAYLELRRKYLLDGGVARRREQQAQD